MGPFALMDLVGQDVNEAVTRSVWAAFGHDPRFAPSLLQHALYTHPDGAWIRNWLAVHGFHEASRGQLRRQAVTRAGSR